MKHTIAFVLIFSAGWFARDFLHVRWSDGSRTASVQFVGRP